MNAYSKRVTHHFTADLEWVITDFGEAWCEFDEVRELLDAGFARCRASIIDGRWRLSGKTRKSLRSETADLLETFFNEHGMPEAEDDND